MPSRWAPLLVLPLLLGCSTSPDRVERPDAAIAPADAAEPAADARMCLTTGESCYGGPGGARPDPTCCGGFCCGQISADTADTCRLKVGLPCAAPNDCCTGACDGKCCVPQGRFCDGFETFCCEGSSCVNTTSGAQCL